MPVFYDSGANVKMRLLLVFYQSMAGLMAVGCGDLMCKKNSWLMLINSPI